MQLVLAVDDLLGGGAARVATLLANAWAQQRRSVQVMTMDDGAKPSVYPLDPAVVHTPLGLGAKSSNWFQGLSANLRRIKILRRALGEARADVVIAFIYRTNIMTILASQGLHNGVIISERSDPARRLPLPWRFLRRLTYPRAHCLVVQTDYAKRYFGKRLEPNIIVIPNPVYIPPAERDLRANLEKNKPRYQVIALGRLHPVKGFDRLISAFSRAAARFPEWDLAIYGEGPARQELEALRDRLGLAKRVMIPGATTTPLARLREADLFVLSSRLEGFPNALIEAMACGLPVISYACQGGPREIISDGVNGITVMNGDVATLGAALEDLFANRPKRFYLGMNARSVLQRYDFGNILQLWETALVKATPRGLRAPRLVENQRPL